MAAFIWVNGKTSPVAINLECVTSVVVGVSGPVGCVVFTTDGRSYAVESQQYYNEILPYISAHLANELPEAWSDDV